MPATASDYYAALQTVQSLVGGLGFILNGQAVQTVIRKLPRKREQIDPATMVFVVPQHQPERFKRMAFGGHYEVTCYAQVVIVAPNNQDQQQNLQTYLAWRQQIAQALVPLLSAPTNILRQDVTYDPPLDRKLISEQYDYSALGLALTLFY